MYLVKRRKASYTTMQFCKFGRSLNMFCYYCKGKETAVNVSEGNIFSFICLLKKYNSWQWHFLHCQKAVC
jgi:hypothetical protein